MVIGYHLTLTAYGFWLPNDPRGSWSNHVGSKAIYAVGGRATKTDERCSVADRPHDRRQRLDAKQSLKRSAVRFDGRQALAVARGFAERLRKDGLTAWTCAVLPDHVHLVLARHARRVELTAARLKAAATKRLSIEGRHPFAHFRNTSGRLPTPWTKGEWKVLLNTPADVRRTIRYVEQNPIKDGKPPQHWSFVTPYDPHSSV